MHTLKVVDWGERPSMISLDDKEIEGVTSISINHNANGLIRVTLEMIVDNIESTSASGEAKEASMVAEPLNRYELMDFEE